MVDTHIRDTIASRLKPERAESYTENSCRIFGNLIVVRLAPGLEVHPRRGRFGSMANVDVREIAEDVVRERFGDEGRIEMRLAYPDCVFEIMQKEKAGAPPSND